MSSSAANDRVRSLLAEVDSAIQADEPQKAIAALKEASHLAPKNLDVENRWLALQKQSSGDDVLESLRSYLDSHEESQGQKTLQRLKQKQLSASDAQDAFNHLLQASEELDLLDAITAALLSRNGPARKQLATEFSANAIQIFNLLLARGEDAFVALTSVVVEDSLWTSKETQSEAQRDLFRLCIAHLIAASAEHLDRVTRSVARLLSVVPDTVAQLVEDDELDAILSGLDIRLEASLRRQALLATSKYLEVTKEIGERQFSHFIERRAARQTNDDLIIVFSAAAAVFPVIPAVAARLFLTDGFVQQLVPNLERNWEEGAAGHRKSHTLETAALELLSAACVDKACREAIERYCAHWLHNLTEERAGTHKALAALTLAKIGADSAEHVTSKLEQLVLDGDAEADQAVEGLAYTTLRGKIREDVVGDDAVLQQLVKILRERPTATFGALTVFSNLTTYRPNQSEEQKKMSQLKAYANQQTPVPDDPLTDDKHTSARCQKLLNIGLVPAIVAACKQTSSPVNVALISRILLSLAREQKHRPTMASQGAVKLLLQIHDRVAKTDKATGEASHIERDAAHALARILISTNPDHVFSSGLPASSAIGALVPLLSSDRDSDHHDLLPTFEALLALTNLASTDDNSVRDLELRLAWSELEDQLLLSSNQLVQRASVELLCNLMASPSCAAKFVGDGSQREKTRLQILLALTDAEDLATRRAAGGAVAVLTEWDVAVTAVLGQNEDKGVKALLRMCADESDEMKHRGFVCMANVLNMPDELGRKGTEMVKKNGGVATMQNALKATKNRDVMIVGVDVLKKLM